jgi:hypothetical protein
MRQTAIAAPDLSPVPAATFTSATTGFVVSLAARIGMSLLLASV